MGCYVSLKISAPFTRIISENPPAGEWAKERETERERASQ